MINKNKFDGDMIKVFNAINREQENNDVIAFQTTQDMHILDNLYKNRIPTLQIWAKKNCYLRENNYNDMFQELSQVFVRTVNGYKASKTICDEKNNIVVRKTPFNTYLFYSLNNYIKNVYSEKGARKRILIDDKGNAQSLLSIEHIYSHGNKNIAIKDIIKDENSVKNNAVNKISYNETLDILSEKEECVRKFFKDIGDGDSMTNLIRRKKIREGSVSINKNEEIEINKNNKDIISDMIKSKIKTNDRFKIVNYSIEQSKLIYKIEMNKTKETEKICKAIRKIRKNKEMIIRKIN